MKTIIIIVLLFLLFKKHKASGAEKIKKGFGWSVRVLAKIVVGSVTGFFGINKFLARVAMEAQVALHPEDENDIRAAWEAWAKKRSGEMLTHEESSVLYACEWRNKWGLSDGEVDGWTRELVIFWWAIIVPFGGGALLCLLF